MTTVSDSFTRANETPLAAPWATGTGDSAMNLSSNAVVVTADGSDCSEIYNGAGAPAWGNDQSSSAKLSSGATATGTGAGLWVRHAAAAQTGYRLIVCAGPPSNGELALLNAGSFTSLLVFSQAWSNGDTWELRAVGTTITVWLNGTQIQTVTDATIASGSPGIASSSNTSSVAWDDWTGTDSFGGGATASLLAPSFRSSSIYRR